jgi:hypothetical protein
VEIAERGRETGRKNRRKPGVERRSAVRAGKKSTKILLTEKGSSQDTLVAPVTAFPVNVPTFLISYPHAGKKVSKEHRCRHNNWKKKV